MIKLKGNHTFSIPLQEHYTPFTTKVECLKKVEIIQLIFLTLTIPSLFKKKKSTQEDCFPLGSLCVYISSVSALQYLCFSCSTWRYHIPSLVAPKSLHTHMQTHVHAHICCEVWKPVFSYFVTFLTLKSLVVFIFWHEGDNSVFFPKKCCQARVWAESPNHFCCCDEGLSHTPGKGSFTSEN